MKRILRLNQPRIMLCRNIRSAMPRRTVDLFGYTCLWPEQKAPGKSPYFQRLGEWFEAFTRNLTDPLIVPVVAAWPRHPRERWGNQLRFARIRALSPTVAWLKLVHSLPPERTAGKLFSGIILWISRLHPGTLFFFLQLSFLGLEICLFQSDVRRGISWLSPMPPGVEFRKVVNAGFFAMFFRICLGSFQQNNYKG